MLGYYAALQVALGPLMSFLGPELGLSHAMSGAHLSAFAVGMIVVGAAGERINRRLGRPSSFWGGAILMGASMVGLLMTDRAVLSLAACLVMGLAGTALLVTIQASLADHHPAWAASRWPRRTWSRCSRRPRRQCSSVPRRARWATASVSSRSSR